MDETKKKMIESAKRQIEKHFTDGTNHVSLDIINVYDDSSGLSGLRYMRCGCCSENVFDDTMRENIQEHFTMDDQLEVAHHFVHLLMDKYGMNKYEKMSKEVLGHLEILIEYLWTEEHKHFEESDRPEKHIFVDVRAIKEWLDGR